MGSVPPRPIEGSAGSRIRLVFGNSGNEWLLLLNHDDGNSTWQSKQWKNIPQSVASQMDNCTAKGRDVEVVDFGPTGAWFIGVKAGGSGEHSWWGNSSAGDRIKEWNDARGSLRACFGSHVFGGETCALVHGDNGYFLSGGLLASLKERLERLNSVGKKVHFIRLFHRGGFAVVDEEGMLFHLGQFGTGAGDPCDEELRRSDAGAVEELAIAGDGSWVVVRPDGFAAGGGVDAELRGSLSDFFAGQRGWNAARAEEVRTAGMRAAAERDRQARERAGQEAAARAEQERILSNIWREAREAERAERDRIEREAENRISSLETMMEERLLEEVKGIEATERTVGEMEADLRGRRSSLREALRAMPPEVRARVPFREYHGADGTTADGTTAKDDDASCVVCRDELAVMAIVPCGHVCLCGTCADSCMDASAGSNLCPLCRGNIQSVLRIYLDR